MLYIITYDYILCIKFNKIYKKNKAFLLDCIPWNNVGSAMIVGLQPLASASASFQRVAFEPPAWTLMSSIPVVFPQITN